MAIIQNLIQTVIVCNIFIILLTLAEKSSPAFLHLHALYLQVLETHNVRIHSDARGYFKCGSCTVCTLSLETKEFHYPQGTCTVNINHVSNCNTCNYVYVVICGCKKKLHGHDTQTCKGDNP